MDVHGEGWGNGISSLHLLVVVVETELREEIKHDTDMQARERERDERKSGQSNNLAEERGEICLLSVVCNCIDDEAGF